MAKYKILYMQGKNFNMHKNNCFYLLLRTYFYKTFQMTLSKEKEVFNQKMRCLKVY